MDNEVIENQVIETAKEVAKTEIAIEAAVAAVDEQSMSLEKLAAEFSAHVESNRVDFDLLRDELRRALEEISALRQQVAALQETLESAADEMEDELREAIREEMDDVKEAADEIADDGAASVMEAEAEETVSPIEEKTAEHEDHKHKRHFVRI